jgi:hypothetical protein
MRVIRTELYFSGSDLKRIGGSRLKSTNVSFAWLNDVDVEALELGRHPAIRPEQVPSVIDHILRQEPLTDEPRILNEGMVYEVMRSEIVIEQSPPEWETLAVNAVSILLTCAEVKFPRRRNGDQPAV